MLSFFSKKKSSPETPPEENGEDFIIVENQQGATSLTNPAKMLPFNPYPHANFGLPSSNYNPPNSSQTPVPYIMGIPFNISPKLCSKTNFEVAQMEVDGILAVMTRHMQMESDYDFNLERGILNECY